MTNMLLKYFGIVKILESISEVAKILDDRNSMTETETDIFLE